MNERIIKRMNELTKNERKNREINTVSWGIWHCLWEIRLEERRRNSSFRVVSCPIIARNLP